MKLTVYVNMPDGSVKEFDHEAILQDGTCLVRDDDEAYHTVVGCEDSFSGWRLTTIEEAKSQGKVACWDCERKIDNLQNFDFDDFEDDF